MQFWQWLRRRWQTFDLLPDYLRKVIQHWNDILWSSIPAFPFVLWWFLGSPPVWVVALVLIWIMIMAGYHAWREDHLLLMPRLQLRYTQLHLHLTNDEERIYVQIIPYNLSALPIDDCQGYLAKVMESAGSGAPSNWALTLLDHRLDLKWSYANSGPRRILPGGDERLNLLWVNNRQQMQLETSVQPTVAASIFNPALGPFRFDVRVAGKDCGPAEISLEVTFKENWRDLEVKQL